MKGLLEIFHASFTASANATSVSPTSAAIKHFIIHCNRIRLAREK